MRRVAMVALAAAGLGLFGTGVRGLAQLDGELADATQTPATQQVRQGLDVRDDCPWADRHDARRL